MTQTNALGIGTIHGDLVDQLLVQHERVRAAIDEVAQTTTAESRQEAFEALCDLLERHEHAEEMIVRPLTRSIADCAAIARARTDEEHESKSVLAELQELDIASVEFARQFEKFAYAVLTHALSEETQEFPLLRQHIDPTTLGNAEKQLLAAESGTPADPYPALDS